MTEAFEMKEKMITSQRISEIPNKLLDDMGLRVMDDWWFVIREILLHLNRSILGAYCS